MILSLPVVSLSLYAQYNPHSRIHSTDKTPFETKKKKLKRNWNFNLEAGGVRSGSIPWPFPHAMSLAGMPGSQPTALHLCHRKTPRHVQNYAAGPAGAASHWNTASPRVSYLGSTWGGKREGNKEPGCCRYLPQEKKGCGRKRTRRGHSHRAERGRAGRAPPSRLRDPRHRGHGAPSCLGMATESLWGEGEHELSRLSVWGFPEPCWTLEKIIFNQG